MSSMRMVEARIKFAHQRSWRSFSTRRSSHFLSAGPPAKMTCSDADVTCGARLNVRVMRMSAMSDFMIFLRVSVCDTAVYSRFFISWWLLFLLGRPARKLHSRRTAGWKISRSTFSQAGVTKWPARNGKWRRSRR